MIIRPIGFEFDLENEVEEQFMISNNVMVVPLLDSSNDVKFFLPPSIWCPLGVFYPFTFLRVEPKVTFNKYLEYSKNSTGRS